MESELLLTRVVPDPSVGELVSKSDSLFEESLVCLARHFVGTQHACEVADGCLKHGDRVGGLTLREVDVGCEVHGTLEDRLNDASTG